MQPSSIFQSSAKNRNLTYVAYERSKDRINSHNTFTCRMYLLKVATVRPENDGASAMEMGVTGSKQELVDDDDGELEDENNDAAEPVKEEVQKKKKIIERKKLDPGADPIGISGGGG
jgi:hypothetical protein